MRKFKKIAGIFAVCAMFSMSFVGCGIDDDTNTESDSSSVVDVDESSSNSEVTEGEDTTTEDNTGTADEIATEDNTDTADELSTNSVDISETSAVDEDNSVSTNE